MKVYVGGTFDLFHWGHVELLKRCAELGEVWVSLNTDEFASMYKRKPIMTFNERRAMLESCRYVTGVVTNTGGKDSKPSILEVMPDIIVHGDDWQGESYLKQLGITQEFLDDCHIEIVYLSYTSDISSSDIIQRCRE